MLTVEKMLTLNFFSEFKLHGGKKGIKNVISNINIMDNPDALDWFSPNELLLTSGYFFKDSDDMQVELINQLHALNCPALCLKSKRYFNNTFPKALLNRAEELGFPVIEIPYGTSFSSIMNYLRPYFFEDDTSYYQFAHDIHNKFSAINLSSGGLHLITETLADLVNNTVVITDPNFLIFDQSSQLTENDKALLIHQNQLSVAFIDQIKATLPEQFDEFNNPLHRIAKFNAITLPYVIYPVRIQTVLYGYILIFDGRPLTNLDLLSVRESAVAYAFELNRRKENERLRNRVKRDFILDILNGKIKDQANIDYLCRTHSLSPEDSFCVGIIDLTFHEDNEKDYTSSLKFKDEKIKQILHTLDQTTGHRHFRFNFISSQGTIFLLMSSSKKQIDYTEWLEEIDCVLKPIVEQFKKVTLKAFIGDISPNVYQVDQSYLQAIEISKIQPSYHNEQYIYAFKDYIVYNLLHENISHEKLQQYLQSSLGKLIDIDNTSSSDLILTLDCWINNHFNYAKTARDLYTHRNTIIYRINKISAILQSDLSNPNELLKYQIGLKIYHLLYKHN